MFLHPNLNYSVNFQNNILKKEYTWVRILNRQGSIDRKVGILSIDNLSEILKLQLT